MTYSAFSVFQPLCDPHLSKPLRNSIDDSVGRSKKNRCSSLNSIQRSRISFADQLSRLGTARNSQPPGFNSRHTPHSSARG